MIVKKLPLKAIKVKDKKEEINYDDLYEYVCQFAKTKYDQECRREDSIIHQASNMQTAFSFVIIALFTISPVIVQYRGVLSLQFLLVVYASITALLLLCLLFATLAQQRKKQTTMPIVEEHTRFIVDHKESFISKAQRCKYMAKTYEEVEKSLHSNNGQRIKYVRLSMIFFYVSLAVCAFWFIVAICKLL